MTQDFDNVDLGWQPEPLRGDWPSGPDNAFILERMEEAFFEIACAGQRGRLLDVACGEGRQAVDLAAHGWDIVGLDPSPEMLVRTKHRADGAGVGFPMFRAIGETLPFRDATFDRLICMSSLDHFADPVKGMREMARVLRPSGTLIIGLVNYHGASCRGSRLLYRAGRRTPLVPAGRRLFWDSPTDGEHTFEGSVDALRRFAAGGPLALEASAGVSMLWAFPGWGGALGLIPGRLRAGRFVRDNALRMLDRAARVWPGASDFVITTWRRN